MSFIKELYSKYMIRTNTYYGIFSLKLIESLDSLHQSNVSPDMISEICGEFEAKLPESPGTTIYNAYTEQKPSGIFQVILDVENKTDENIFVKYFGYDNEQKRKENAQEKWSGTFSELNMKTKPPYGISKLEIPHITKHIHQIETVAKFLMEHYADSMNN